MKTPPKNSNKITSFEWYWNQYISKLARLDELKALGRYGYQLRMPKKAIHVAAQSMRDFCKANGIECPSCL
jgi:hypothetical protein